MKNDRTDLSYWQGPSNNLPLSCYRCTAIRTKEAIVLSRETARPHKNRFYVEVTQYHKDHFCQT